MDAKELKEVLENHKHWLNEDCDGWQDMRANLRGADLRGANLRGANLRGANLRGANLRGANLRGADLDGADLYGADLYGANLRGANLRGANLDGANLRGANLSEADLDGADLYGADLRGANLDGANLRGADLRGANLSEADLDGANLRGADLRGANLRGADFRGAKNVPFIPLACPDTGAFIGFKKAILCGLDESMRQDVIVELEILADARRSSATGRKCRCDKAKVLSVTTLNGAAVGADAGTVHSSYNPDFVYKVGEIVTATNFWMDRWEECAPGIHFFINRQEAVEY